MLPDGRQVKLWCRTEFHSCRHLEAGRYAAQLHGNSLYIFGDFSGKERKAKYRVLDVIDPSK